MHSGTRGTDVLLMYCLCQGVLYSWVILRPVCVPRSSVVLYVRAGVHDVPHVPPGGTGMYLLRWSRTARVLLYSRSKMGVCEHVLCHCGSRYFVSEYCESTVPPVF